MTGYRRFVELDWWREDGRGRASEVVYDRARGIAVTLDFVDWGRCQASNLLFFLRPALTADVEACK